MPMTLPLTLPPTVAETERVAVPGDPDGLDVLARRCRHASGGLRADVDLLRGAAGIVGWSGPAAGAFARSVREVPRDLDRAAASFEAVGAALAAYAADLRDAQQRADRVQRELDQLAGQHLADGHHLVDPVGDPQADAARALRQARYDEHADQLRRRIAGLADTATLAAGAASCRVRAASDAPHPPSGLLARLADAAGDWVEEHAGPLTDLSFALKSLAAAAGSLAMVPALAPVLGPVAVAAGVLALGVDVALASRRRASWVAVGVDAVVAAAPGLGRVGAVAVRELRTRRGSSVVYRVEGDSNTRIVIDGDRDVRFQGRDMLYINVDQRTQAQLYLRHKIADGLPGAQIKSFRIPRSEVEELRRRAVAQAESKAHPRAPHRVDETQAPDLYGLRRHDFRALQKTIIPGTGKVLP